MVELAIPDTRAVAAHTATPARDIRILTVMSCSGRDRSGMPTANASISRELRAAGCAVDHVYVEDFPSAARRPWLTYPAVGLLTVPLVRRLEERRGPYDVLQISGGDGFAAPLLRRDRQGRRRLVVARCHGLEHRYWEAFQREVGAGHTSASLRHRWYFGGLRLKQVELAIRGADLLNCHTRADAQTAVARGWKRPDQVAVLPSGIEADWFDPAPRRATWAKRVLFCGTWAWMKGTRVLAEVFGQLARTDPAVRLTVITTGADERTVLGALSPTVRHRVRVLRDLPHREVLLQFQRHDLLLATSLFEGFGTVVVEAMAAGLPVVASDVGGATEYISHGRSGFLAPPGDVEALAAACQRALDAPANVLHAMRSAARDAVADLAWPDVAAATAAVYASALARVRGET